MFTLTKEYSLDNKEQRLSGKQGIAGRRETEVQHNLRRFAGSRDMNTGYLRILTKREYASQYVHTWKL